MLKFCMYLEKVYYLCLPFRDVSSVGSERPATGGKVAGLSGIEILGR